jgi:hypothetical protein
LNPHHSRKQQRSNRSEHLIPRRLDIVMGFCGFKTFLACPIKSKSIQSQLPQSFRSSDCLLKQQM